MALVIVDASSTGHPKFGEAKMGFVQLTKQNKPGLNEFQQKYTVRFWCKGGFTLEEEVEPKIADIIFKAIEYGKELRSKEISDLLKS